MNIPDAARAELVRFWHEHPDLRRECKRHYGFDPITREQDYWKHGLGDEPEHKDVLTAVNRSGEFTLALVKRWEREELAAARREGVGKAANITAHLHVVGVQTHPSGQRVYRLATRDGHYIGRTNPTKTRALKGDVLKVEIAHLRMLDSGDMYWQNTQVAGIRTGMRADSHRDLVTRLSGNTDVAEMSMVKDGAADVPAAGDVGSVTPQQTLSVPTGPTDSGVHVDRPLKNISVFYGRKRKGDMKVLKAMPDQQILYGIVLEPDVFDSQADYVPAAHVEKAAHGYLKRALRGGTAVTKLQHRMPAFHRNRASVVPVESFIAPCDFTYPGSNEPVKKGSWVLAVHVEDPATWQEVIDGHWGGFSIGGTGRRQRMGGMMDRPPALV